MNKPNFYLQLVNQINKRSQIFFDKYFGLVRQNDTKKKVLDIGCGPGNVTHDILYPYFKHDLDEVVGIDRSKAMVQYANAIYKNKKFIFKELDVIHGPGLEKFQEYFDYVFSLWTLHWILDQRSLYKNIYQMMKPDSDLLVTYVARSELYEVYRTVWNKPIYRQYIKDFSGMKLSFKNSENPVQDLRLILESVGFEVHLCELTKCRLFRLESFKPFFISITSAYDQIPTHLQEDFIADHIEEMNKNSRFIFEDQLVLDFDMFVVYARKN